jgi:hypothetical protein
MWVVDAWSPRPRTQLQVRSTPHSTTWCVRSCNGDMPGMTGYGFRRCVSTQSALVDAHRKFDSVGDSFDMTRYRV